MDSTRTTALVIGCGPAGAAAATTLARAGVACVVLDRAHFPRDKTCGDAISNEAVVLLERLGAADRILAGPHAEVRRSRAWLPNRATITRDYDPPGLIVARWVLDDALRQTAIEAGARVVEGEKVERLIVEGGRVVGARGPSGEWRADLVISADGHGSLARATLDHPKPTERLLALGCTDYLVGVRYDEPATSEHYFLHALPFGYAWVFPAVEGVTNVGVYQRSDHYEAKPQALERALDDFLHQHPERFADATSIGRRRSWPLPLSPAPWRLSAPGLVAVGDAGNHVDPLSGEGIWQALRSGELAASLYLEDPGALETAYAQACEREITRKHRLRRHVQLGLHWLLRTGLYRSAAVRWVLERGYASPHVENTKLIAR